MIECVYCATPVSRSSAAHMTCAACRKRFEAEFGANWFEADWHRALMPAAVRFEHESAKLAQAVRLDADDAPEISAADVVQPVEHLPVRHRGIYQAVLELHVTAGLGAKRIHSRLTSEGQQVSLATVCRYLRIVKAQTAQPHEDERGVEAHPHKNNAEIC